MQRQVSKLNSAMRAVLILYVLGLTLVTFALVSNFASMLFPTTYPYCFSAANVGLSVSAGLFVLLGSVVTTVAGGVATDALSDLGDVIGIRVIRGIAFLKLTWCAFGVIVVAASYWVGIFHIARHRRISR